MRISVQLEVRREIVANDPREYVATFSGVATKDRGRLVIDDIQVEGIDFGLTKEELDAGIALLFREASNRG